MKSYRAAIVGLSGIAIDPAPVATHPSLGTAMPFGHAAAYAATPRVTVVAGCDIAPAACDRFVEIWAGTWPNVKTYADYRVMLDNEKIDILSVVTPDDRHVDIVIAAVDAGIPAIYAEKPFATSLADADAMIAAIEAKGTLVSVNLTRRWYPSYVAAQQYARDGGIGNIVQIIGHHGGPRAMLYRIHSHLLDIICAFADADPSWVVAELEPGFEGYGTAYAGDGGRDPSREPGANAYIVFENGTRAFVSGFKQGSPEFYLDIIGETGRLHVNDSLAVVYSTGEGGQTSRTLSPQSTRAGMQAAMAELIDALETGSPISSTPRQARQTVALIDGILHSQANGNAPFTISAPK